MDRAKLKELLRDIGVNAGNRGDYKDSGINVQFCCPFHGERRPSAGINVDKEFGKCFACGETFTIPKLVAHCLDFTHTFKDKEGKSFTSYDYKKANEWLDEKYDVGKRELEYENKVLRRIDDEEEDDGEYHYVNLKEGRHELNRVELAPFRSGKSIHEYFFSRGFTKDTAQKFMIGWDAQRLRVTIPVFWEDGVLDGIIGRAVLEQKVNGKDNPEFYKVYKGKNNVKYYIYDNFPTGQILYPINHFKPIDKTAILVEGQFDAIWLHQMGYSNALSSMTSKLVVDKKTGESNQIEILKDHGVKKVILLRDNDKAGREGNEHDYELLRKDFSVYGVEYPTGVKDPQNLTKRQLRIMLRDKFPFIMKGQALRRID